MKFVGILGIGCLILALAGVALVGSIAIYGLNCVNTEIVTHNQIQAQSQKNQASLDTMWKIIQQKAGIVGKYSGDTKEIYKDIVQGRSGGALFKTVQENSPNPLSEAMFKDMMNAVEAGRKGFLRDQTQLLDYIQTRKNLIESPISGLFLRLFGTTTAFKPKGDPNTPADWPNDFQYTFVTSAATQTMVSTGQENDVKLDFGEKK